MKKHIKPYFISFSFLIISYLLLSFIFTIIFSFIHCSSFIYTSLINISSYLIIIISMILLLKTQKKPTYLAGLIFCLIYTLFLLIINIRHYKLTLVIKPILILISYYILIHLKKRSND